MDKDEFKRFVRGVKGSAPGAIEQIVETANGVREHDPALAALYMKFLEVWGPMIEHIRRRTEG